VIIVASRPLIMENHDCEALIVVAFWLWK